MAALCCEIAEGSLLRDGVVDCITLLFHPPTLLLCLYQYFYVRLDLNLLLAEVQTLVLYLAGRDFPWAEKQMKDVRGNGTEGMFWDRAVD